MIEENLMLAVTLKQKNNMRHYSTYGFFLLVLFLISPWIDAASDFNFSIIKDKVTRDAVEEIISVQYPSRINSWANRFQIFKLASDQYQYLVVPVSTQIMGNKPTAPPTGCYLHILSGDYYAPVKRYVIQEDDFARNMTVTKNNTDGSPLATLAPDMKTKICVDLKRLFECKTAHDHGIGVIYTVTADLHYYENVGIFFDVLSDGSFQENKSLTQKMTGLAEADDAIAIAKKNLGCLPEG